MNLGSYGKQVVLSLQRETTTVKKNNNNLKNKCIATDPNENAHQKTKVTTTIYKSQQSS